MTLGINDLACSLGKSSGIALQGVSPAAPKLAFPKPSAPGPTPVVAVATSSGCPIEIIDREDAARAGWKKPTITLVRSYS
jgi:hypothetical protein